MQTPTSRPASFHLPKNPSPATSRAARKHKTLGSDSGLVSSPNTMGKTTKDKSPKVFDQRPATEVLPFSLVLSFSSEFPPRRHRVPPISAFTLSFQKFSFELR